MLSVYQIFFKRCGYWHSQFIRFFRIDIVKKRLEAEIAVVGEVGVAKVVRLLETSK